MKDIITLLLKLDKHTTYKYTVILAGTGAINKNPGIFSEVEVNKLKRVE